MSRREKRPIPSIYLEPQPSINLPAIKNSSNYKNQNLKKLERQKSSSNKYTI